MVMAKRNYKLRASATRAEKKQKKQLGDKIVEHGNQLAELVVTAAAKVAEKYKTAAELAGVKHPETALAYETVRVAIQTLMVGGAQALGLIKDLKGKPIGEPILRDWLVRMLNEVGGELTEKTGILTRFTLERGKPKGDGKKIIGG